MRAIAFTMFRAIGGDTLTNLKRSLSLLFNLSFIILCGNLYTFVAATDSCVFTLLFYTVYANKIHSPNEFEREIQ